MHSSKKNIDFCFFNHLIKTWFYWLRWGTEERRGVKWVGKGRYKRVKESQVGMAKRIIIISQCLCGRINNYCQCWFNCTFKRDGGVGEGEGRGGWGLGCQQANCIVLLNYCSHLHINVCRAERWCSGNATCFSKIKSVGLGGENVIKLYVFLSMMYYFNEIFKKEKKIKKKLDCINVCISIPAK